MGMISFLVVGLLIFIQLKKFRTFNWGFLLLLFLSNSLFSQKSVSGVVSDDLGNPLAQVVVKVSGTSDSIFTDKDGYYSILVPEGYNTVSFHYPGYRVKSILVSSKEYNVTFTNEMLEVFNLSLHELMNLEITVASKKALTPRQSPGIVSIITKEEIRKSGCRDLIDVLNMVPGFSMGLDVQGVTNAIIRGIWAHEGKFLLMMDGLELNELSYSTIQLGNHYNVDQIERIEIIRGPGSAIYGGFAESGVINLITNNNQNKDLLTIGGNYGQMTETYARRNAYFTLNNQINLKTHVSLSGFIGQGNRSDQVFKDIYGKSYNMNGNSKLDPMIINLQTQISDFNFKLLFDHYKTTNRDLYSSSLLKAYRNDFITIVSEANYHLKISPKHTIIPRLNYKRSKPYYTYEKPEPGEDPIYSQSIVEERVVNRMTGSINSSYDMNEKINFLNGFEYYHDIGNDLSNDPLQIYWNKKKEIHYQNIGLYSQFLFNHPIANLILGLRADIHSQYGSEFAPRIAITKVFDPLHLKTILSQAYRSPGIENINLNAALNPEGKPNIKPEQMNVAEIELGYKINDFWAVTSNFFYMKLNNPIVFYVDRLGYEGYKNVKSTGSKGFEIEIRNKMKWSDIRFNYSYYNSKGLNLAPDFEVPENRSVMLGASPSKLNAILSFDVSKKISLNPSLVYFSSKYAYTSYDLSTDQYIQKKIEPELFLNFFIHTQDLFAKGLMIGIGVHDILNTTYTFVQPYNGGHSPLPGTSRELVLKVKYLFDSFE